MSRGEEATLEFNNMIQQAPLTPSNNCQQCGTKCKSVHNLNKLHKLLAILHHSSYTFK